MRTIAAGTSWLIQDGPDVHESQPYVIEGDVKDFRVADFSLSCLCQGVPVAFREGTHIGLDWDARKVDDDTVRVTLKHDYEYDPDRHPALATCRDRPTVVTALRDRW